MFNSKRAIEITHRTELLFWLIILLIIIAVSSMSYIYKSKNDENDYQIFLPDVDGLIVGSPVRMMGVEVGHVVKLRPLRDEVYVKFVITNKDVYIPQGSQITVEFSGMAGSKSLELYLPDENTYIDKNTPIIQVNPPKRLYDAIYLLDDMYKKLGSIIHSVSSFGGKLEEAMPKHEENNSTINNDFGELINFSNKFLDDSTKKANEIRNNIEGLINNGK